MSKQSKAQTKLSNKLTRLTAQGMGSAHTVTLRKYITWTSGDQDRGTKPTPLTWQDTLLPCMVDNINVKDIEVGNGRIVMGDLKIYSIPRTYDSLITDKSVVWIVAGPSFNGNYSLVDGEITFTDAICSQAMVRKKE